MRVLGSAVITMEFFVMGFALLLAKDHHSATALWIGGVIAILCLLTAGMMRNIRGWYIGTLVQVALIAYGVVVPMMYFMGALFAVLWGSAYIVGRKGEAVRAALVAQAAENAQDSDSI
jgi:Protein of unknown function (DUF4233)